MSTRVQNLLLVVALSFYTPVGIDFHLVLLNVRTLSSLALLVLISYQKYFNGEITQHLKCKLLIGSSSKFQKCYFWVAFTYFFSSQNITTLSPNVVEVKLVLFIL